MKKTLCELFAWVWWFRVWLEKANKEWETVWASQWEPGKKVQHAYNCYVSQFWDYEYMNTDIHEVVEKHMKVIPNHTLLVWWFPCQDYSVARTWAKWIQGKKWVLWWDIKAILQAKKPDFVLLENVDRLLKSPGNQRWRDFWMILASFDELWYSVEWRVINAADYWWVQRRRRTFIFAYKNTTKYWKSLKGISFEDLLHKDWFFVQQFWIEKYTPDKEKGEIVLEYSDLADISDKFQFDFYNAWVMKKGKIYTEEVTPYYKWKKMVIWDILEENADEKYYISADKMPKRKYLKWAKRIIRKEWTPHQYTFSEWAIAFPDPLDRPARTMLTSEGSLNRSTHVVEPKKWRLRILTPVETERINWFPDNWTAKWWMPEKFRYFCMGNALCVKMITKMWKILDDIIEKED